MRVRALVLAAGYGTRLAPLTLRLPKPLLPVLGTSVLERTLRSLAASGCEAAVVNLHHLGDHIRQRIGDSCEGMAVTYSPEEQVLGTLGAVVRKWRFLRDADQVLVVNGDSLCDWPLKRLLGRHRRSPAPISLLVHRSLDPSGYGGGVGVDQDNKIVCLRGQPAGTEPQCFRVFLGAQVMSGEVFGRLDRLAEGPADLVGDLYIPLLREGWQLGAISTRRSWHDLGTPSRYLEGCLDRARGLRPRLLWRRSWISPQARIDQSARVSRSIIEPGATVGPGAVVDTCVVMQGAEVGSRCRLDQCLIGPQARLPAAMNVATRMVTGVLPGYRPDTRESVISGLVFSPLS